MLIYAVIVAVLGFVRAHAHLLPARGRPGHPVQPGDVAGRRDPGAHLAVTPEGREALFEDEKDMVERCSTVAGFSFGGSGQNMGIGFVEPAPLDERHGATGTDVKSVAGRHGGLLADPRGHGVRLRSAGGMELGTSNGGFDRRAAGPLGSRP